MKNGVKQKPIRFRVVVGSMVIKETTNLKAAQKAKAQAYGQYGNAIRLIRICR